MRVLILGANGFIGHHMVRRILDATDWNVSAIDVHNNHLQWAIAHPRFAFHRGDIRQMHEWIDQEILRSDVVLPLAAIANPMVYVKDPLRVFELVFEENLWVVRQCVRHGARLIFPSTSEVYGMCADEEFVEDKSFFTFGPVGKERWIYATSKHLLERVIHAYGREGLRFTIFRPFNIIGPNLDNIENAGERGGARVVTQFLGRMLAGHPIELVDGGRQSRSFTDISDGVDALLRIVSNEGGAADGRIFNIGNPANLTSISGLATIMASVLETFPGYKGFASRLQLQAIPATSYFGENYQDVARRKPDITALRGLGWEPRVDLRESLRRTIAHYLPLFEARAVA